MKKHFLACLIAALALQGAAAIADETRTFIDDAGRSVEIPASPARIASLHDLYFSVPLIELGVPPIASHGRVDGEAIFMRSAKMLTGVDFDTSGIAFLGAGVDIDPEIVAAAEPDLIILSTNQDPALYAHVAPTILLDFNVSDKFEIYERLAELTDSTAQLDILKARYGEQVSQLAALANPAETSINVIAAVSGQVRSYHRFAALGKVLGDAGFAAPEALADVAYGEFADFSPELFPEMDADIVFVTYRAEFGETPADAYAQLEGVVPGFCGFISACHEGRMIAIPRDETLATSYAALGSLAYAVLATSTAARLDAFAQ